MSRQICTACTILYIYISVTIDIYVCMYYIQMHNLDTLLFKKNHYNISIGNLFVKLYRLIKKIRKNKNQDIILVLNKERRVKKKERE